MSNSANIISLNITKFPQNLLIPDMDNDVSLQVINNSDKKENFKFVFEGKNLDINLKSAELKDQIEFAPKETKNIDIRLNPTAGGFGKLTINAYWLKIVEYTVKVQKVRDVAPKSKFHKIFDNYKITIEVIDKTIRQLAKGYLSNKNLQVSLSLALELSDPNEQLKFYVNLIRAHAIENLSEALQIIKNLKDLNLQQNLLKSVVFDQIHVNPIQAFNLTENITNLSVKIKLLFNIAQELYDNNKSSELLTVLKRIIEVLFKSPEINSEDKKDQKLIYDSLKDAINGIAEIEIS